MTRETENALLLLIGLSTAIITISGSYTRYVKPSLLPWLAGSALLLIALALVAIIRDVRRGSADGSHHDGHPHRSTVAWLLVVPVALLGFIVPPAITPQAAGPSVIEVSTDVLRRPYPPLPDERAPMLSLPEVLTRLKYDSANTLDGKLITVTGFTMKENGSTSLARVVMLCCAADARLERIRLSGPAAPQIAAYPEDTWLTVEGKIPAGQSDSTGKTIPTMDVLRESRIDPPANPYVY
ncbi:MAG TPA: TIGR03943 family protein [Mycobacterium sp.]|nr:TIGR03943 family protein [Mycobacterium sp.]